METTCTASVMPLGKFRGQPLDEMTTPYLMWLLSQDAIRFKYRNLMRQSLDVLRARFADFDKLVDELSPQGEPPEYWKVKETVAAIRQKRKEERHRQEQANRVNVETSPGVLLDASYYVREAQQKRAQEPEQVVDPNDVSDLI